MLHYQNNDQEIYNTLYDHNFAPGETRDHEYYGIQMVQWAFSIRERLDTPVTSFVCDGDSTILKGARYARSLYQSKYENPPFVVRCSAHLLNLLCHDIIKALGAKTTVKEAGSLCGYFRRAGEDNCGLPRKMARMTDVRWNSALDLLDSVTANRNHITEYSKKKKLPQSVECIIQDVEFWNGVLKLMSVIRPVCIALDIVQSDSIKFGETIGIIVSIVLAIRHSDLAEIDKFHVIGKCEHRLDSLIKEDQEIGKVGFCLHCTAYFCHPGYRGFGLSTDIECKMISEDGLKMLLARRQREGTKVTESNVSDCVKLMFDFVSLEGEAWTMRFGSSNLIDIDPVMYWGSYITNPFIGLPHKTAHTWELFKSGMLELFGMWVTTASLERAFSIGKQLSPPQKSRLSVSTTASQLLIKTHYKLYREPRERCRSSRRIPIEFDNPGSLSNIFEELDLEEVEEVMNEGLDERTLRRELRSLKLWNIESCPKKKFPSKLNALIPQYLSQENTPFTDLSNDEGSDPADLSHY